MKLIRRIQFAIYDWWTMWRYIDPFPQSIKNAWHGSGHPIIKLTKIDDNEEWTIDNVHFTIENADKYFYMTKDTKIEQ